MNRLSLYSKNRSAPISSPVLLLGSLLLTVCGVAGLQAQTVTTTTLTLSSASVAAKTAVMLTAVVNGSNNVPVATGLVTFQDGKTVLGSAQIVSSSETASLKIVPGLGDHPITATFAGTTTAAKSSSAAQTVTVTGMVPTTTAITEVGYANSSNNVVEYALTGTVTSTGRLAATGAVSFTDQTNSNLLGSATLGAATASLAFQPQLTYGVGSNPSSVAVGDFNGDGIPDLAVANSEDNTVSVLLGQGDGTFTSQPTLEVGSFPNCVAVGDFNGDGIPDLAVANLGGNTVGVLLGKGDGTFSSATLEVVDSPYVVAVGDFNGDGIPDLAAANFNRATVSVLLGQGDGTFTSKSTPGVGFNPDSLAVGDFNGDGIPDLAVANLAGATVSVLLGQGDGTFTSKPTLKVGSYPTSVAVGDFNGDGIPDLAVANSEDTTVSVLQGLGDGTFTGKPTLEVGFNPNFVAVGDFNLDGIPDLAVALNGGTVSVLQGLGDGTFTSESTPGVGSSPYSVAVGDFNGDGVPDLVTANAASSNVSVLLNNLTQTANATLSERVVTGMGTHQVAAQYAGDSFHQPSTSTSIGLLAFPLSPSLALTVNPSTVPAGQPVTLTAGLSVYSSGSLHTTGEPVTFYNGSAVLGMGTLNGVGQASLTTSALPVGQDSLSARYGGDSNFTAATSNTDVVTVTAGPQFTLTPLPPQETIPRGRIAGFLLSLKSANGFNGNVTLTCSGGPTGSYCVDFPQQVHVNGQAYAVSGIFFPKNTTPGTYTITFTGVSGALTRKATATFTVTGR